MTIDELQQIADDYTDVAAKSKQLKGEMDILKSNIVGELEKIDDNGSIILESIEEFNDLEFIST